MVLGCLLIPSAAPGLDDDDDDDDDDTLLKVSNCNSGVEPLSEDTKISLKRINQ